MSAEVFRDAWGIPHLRADDALELAFAQGRNAAVDRAWQLEVERHRVQGTSAAFLGPDALGWDRFARRARLDDTARRCFEALDDDTAAWVVAYVDGVDAGLEQGARRAPEFASAGLAPGRWRPWTPLGIWLAAHVLFAGFPTKLWREKVARHLGDDAISMFATDGPASSGSNGWLIAGERTVTGAPLLAGDPHRFLEDPGFYQQLHLACPEFDVVGLAVPGVPGIAHFGHTGRVAWAITNAMADYQDLYRERLRRRGAMVEAYGPDGWRAATSHRETVEVAGGEPVEIEVIVTDRGPVVIGGPDEPDAISLRCPPRVTSELGFAALPALLRATTVADVDRAFDRWVEPVNVVLAADVHGGLLHRVAGKVPRRHADNSLRVVPGWDSTHEWRRWHDPLPRAPVDGIAVMANERGLAAPLGVEFAAPHRARRIHHLLSSGWPWSAKDQADVLGDTVLGSAAALIEVVAGLDGLSLEGERLRGRLLDWDRRMDADSGGAAVFGALRSAVVRRLAAHPILAPLDEPDERSGSGGDPGIFRPWLAVAPRVAFALEHLLTGALPGVEVTAEVRAAVEQVAAEAANPATWGQTHRLTLWRAEPPEPLEPSAPAHPGPRRPGPEPGPEPGPSVSGDHDCVLSTSTVPGLVDTVVRGPAARYVWDLGRRDDSLWVVPLGASGIRTDPHHHDQLAPWLRGDLVPVVTDWNLLSEERDDH